MAIKSQQTYKLEDGTDLTVGDWLRCTKTLESIAGVLSQDALYQVKGLSMARGRLVAKICDNNGHPGWWGVEYFVPACHPVEDEDDILRELAKLA